MYSQEISTSLELDLLNLGNTLEVIESYIIWNVCFLETFFPTLDSSTCYN